MQSRLIERLSAIREEAKSLRAELAELTAADTLSPVQEARFDELTGADSPITALVDEKADIEQRLALTRSSSTAHERSDVPEYMKRTSTDIDPLRAGRDEIRSAALAVLEREHDSQEIAVSDAAAAHLERQFGRRITTDDGEVIFDGDRLARRFLITESPAYRSAFQKGISQVQPAWDPDEVRALNEFRAAEQSLTSASGGYGAPVLIDPTIIITSGAADAPVLNAMRIELIHTNAWKGVSSAGVAFAAEAESDPIAAQQATLAQPSISVFKRAAFIPFTFEIEGDYPNFAGEMQRLIEQAYIDDLAIATMTGAGSAGPKGIFTALDAVVGSEVAVTTDGALGPVDALKVWGQLPERHRQRASFVSSVTVQNQFRNNGSTDGFFSVDLSQNNVGTMLGRPYYLSDYAPAFTGTTGAANLCVVADLNKYYLIQRVGMQIELVPHIFDGDGLPKGQRGWLAWARNGGDFVDTNAGRLLQNT